MLIFEYLFYHVVQILLSYRTSVFSNSSACLESLSYSLSGNTDIVKYIKREIIKACTNCYNGSEEQVRINREETSCQKSEHYPRYGTDQVTHTRSCVTFIRATDLPTLYVHLDFLTLKARYYYFHFKSDTSKLSSRENKTAVKDSIVRIGTSVYLTWNTHSFWIAAPNSFFSLIVTADSWGKGVLSLSCTIFD